MSAVTKEKTLVGNIMDMYENNIIDQADYRSKVSEYFKVKESSVRVGWFHRQEFPTKYRVIENLIVFTQKYIQLNGDKQNLKTA